MKKDAAIRFVVPRQPMWPAEVRAPPCRSVASEVGGWPSGGAEGAREGASGNGAPRDWSRAFNGHRPPSRLEIGGRNTDGTWCLHAFCLTRCVLYQSLDRIRTHLARFCQDCVSATSLRLGNAQGCQIYCWLGHAGVYTSVLFCCVVHSGPIQHPLLSRPRQLPYFPSQIAKIYRTMSTPFRHVPIYGQVVGLPDCQP
jgi:hypothetical protein